MKIYDYLSENKIIDRLSDIRRGLNADDILDGVKFVRNTFRKIATSIFCSEEKRKLVSGDII